ncbi:MAG: hypothetical protein AAF329_25655 [Cyanobacteria bacterium P01_A01_bin.17]
MLWLALLGSAGLSIRGVQAQQPEWQQPEGSSAVAVSFKAQPTLQDGTYLYGRTQKPEQAQTEYFVFRVRNQRVIGAFYMPQSSFDCFRGDLKAQQLELTVMGYEQQVYRHTVSLNAYHPIGQVSDNDHRIVEACQADANLATLD